MKNTIINKKEIRTRNSRRHRGLSREFIATLASAIMFIVVLAFAPQQAQAYGAAWTRTAPITINNAAAGALTDYQVKVNVTYDAYMKADFSDLRFTTADGATEIPYWIESKTNSTSAVVWVKVPSLPAGNTTIYMYYGNPNAVSAGNGTATFDFFDDFSGDLSKWTTNGVTITSGQAVIAAVGSAWGNYMWSNATFDRTTIGYELKYDLAVNGATSNYHETIHGWGNKQTGYNIPTENLYYGETIAWNTAGIDNGTWRSPGISAVPAAGTLYTYTVRIDKTSGGLISWSGDATTISLSGSGNNMAIKINPYKGGVIADNFRVRKYTSSEPTVSVGAGGATAPTVSISAPANNSTVNTSTVTVSGTASGFFGLSKVEVSVNGGAYVLAAGTTSWSANATLGLGANTITARATDAVGNVSTRSVSVTYDTTAPTVSISAPANNATVNTTAISVSGSASDNIGVSKVEVQVGAGAWTSATGTTDWSANVTLAAGANTITARSVDKAGNLSATASITVTCSTSTLSTPSTTSTITYDRAGRKTGMTDPDMGTWSYTYDANGNLKTQTDAKGQIITITYDKANRVTLKDYPGTTYDTNYVYDNTTSSPGGKGRLFKVYGYSGGNANQYFEEYGYYDELGRNKQSKLCLSSNCATASTAWTTSIGYDAAGRVSTITYPDGEVVTYRYNAAGKLDSPDGGVTPAVQSSMYTGYAYVKDITFNPRGQMASIAFGNSRITTYDYYDTGTEAEPDSNLVYTYRLKNVTTDGNIQSMSYGYDKTGNVMRANDNINSNYSAYYSYDDLSRLAVATSTAFGGTLSFGYNAIDNLLNKDGRIYTYPTIGRPHAPTGDGTYTYTYDNNGNMLTRAAATTRTFTWDYDNMVSSIVDSGTTKGTYAYAEGARIKKVEGTSTTYYVGGIYEEEWISGVKTNITKYYNAGSRIAKRKNGTVSFIHADHLGSSSRTTDANGALQYTIVYKPYGEDAYSNDTGAVDYRFTGKEKDDATGLYYYGARYYDPVLGRFISADSVEGPNRYAYVRNNPVNNIDPTGNSTMSINLPISINRSIVTPNLVIPVFHPAERVSYRKTALGTDPFHPMRGDPASVEWRDTGLNYTGAEIADAFQPEIGTEAILAEFTGFGQNKGAWGATITDFEGKKWREPVGGESYSANLSATAAMVWNPPLLGGRIPGGLFVAGANNKSAFIFYETVINPAQNNFPVPIPEKYKKDLLLKGDAGHTHIQADIPFKDSIIESIADIKLWIRATAGGVSRSKGQGNIFDFVPFGRFGDYIQFKPFGGLKLLEKAWNHFTGNNSSSNGITRSYSDDGNGGGGYSYGGGGSDWGSPERRTK